MLKILHTADWHLGKRLHKHDLLSDQLHFLNFLETYLLEQKIDVLLVSGDIFDTAYPPLSALEAYNNHLAQLFKQEYPRYVIITDGNHDGRTTLKVPKQLLASLNTTVVCELDEERGNHLIPITNTDGTLAAYVVAVPFLRELDLRKSVLIEGEVDRLQAIRQGIQGVYQQLAEEVEQVTKERTIPVVATGHLYVQGAEAADSDAERPVQIGHQAGVQTEVFSEAFDYVALGHIHKAQQLKGNTDIRYSGSPYPLSFSERNYTHQMWLLHVGASAVEKVESVLLPIARRFKQFNGTFEQVKEKVTVYAAQTDSLFTDLLALQIEEEAYDPSLRYTIDQWRMELHEQTETVQIVKYSLHFQQETQNAAELLKGERIKQEDFNAQKVFEARLQDEVSMPEDEKEILREAFMQLLEQNG
ncbi:exonuclease subunit SbcD [Algivirga pacifica]|uniref:Nuclease SbcCD subunit D n=1 Tax=Algivirga pacifica TaxID=1162670 RepID=A0ABP9DIK1_9BACT